MSCHHETIQRDGQTLDVLTDDASGTSLTVSRLGAAPVSFTRRETDGFGGTQSFLWRDNDLSPAPPGAWNGHCTVMGYYLHRLLNGRTTYRGHEMRGGTHSFLRLKTFPEPVVEISPGELAALTYTMTPDGYVAHEYPYRVTLHLTYLLERDGTWLTRFRFESGEPDISTHVSFGLHPGLAVSTLSQARVLLPPGCYRRHLAPGNFLSGETVDLQHGGGPMPFDMDRLIDSFILEFVDVTDPVITVDDGAGARRVAVDCRQAPYVTIWSDGHDFICVEPCWGLPDAHEQVPFEQKAGIEEIAPGGILEREFAIRASPGR